ncbi:SDR family NAD(P)-dependent oxidoreductase [Actinomadura roseirufa]|uniref:SDR family NAD(P)-dependent oxidoreductase n=1 Tax=Actinomadura roseirufa TaxID=2094049 RepID=UPI00104113C8|nr:SDR family NAD(P)-dependent oxidoreductase [Actinomadura roseirufa]
MSREHVPEHVLEHVLVTGGAGFIGSHLCHALLERGARVTAVDNLSAGRPDALEELDRHDRFTLVEHDVTVPLEWAGPLTAVVHLASPVGPARISERPVATLLAGSAGTVNALEIARRRDVRIVLASSSEVYGDPAVQPQSESYWGNVDPVGPLSGYTEGKRFLEAMATAYRHEYGVNTGIVRPFNVYGPGALPGDRRVVPTFVTAALAGRALTLAGGGQAVRSLVYVADFVAGLIAMLESDESGPINLGSAAPVTIAELAELVVRTAGSGTVQIIAGRTGEAAARCPDVSKAARVLGWEATTPLEQGLAWTVESMRQAAARTAVAAV